MNPDTVARIGFVLERSLGHITHADNLSALLPGQPGIDPVIAQIEFEVSGPAAKVPVFNSNWTVRAGLRTRRVLRRLQREAPLDGLFVHTQVPAVLAPDWLRRVPTVVSLDATPLQYDELGAHYDHEQGNPRVERLKWRANRTCFERAAHIVTWSTWAKDGVVEGYGIDPAKITVIPPGVRPALWHPGPGPRPAGTDGPVRILFVGGDLERKGGDVLLQAFAALRGLEAGAGGPGVELHLVTRSAVPATPGVVVHADLQPNSPGLIELYHRSDIFCLPTRGDCLPMVLSEAGAAELPLVSTAVAAIPEIVRDGETGLVVPVDDVAALAAALRTLVEQPELRRRLGAGARQLVDQQYDAGENVRRLVDLLRTEVAARPTGRTRRPARAALDGVGNPAGRVLLTVSGVVPTDVTALVADGQRPRPDYVELARRMDADVVDVVEARRRSGLVGRVAERAGGAGALLAWVCFRERRRYDAVFTDGEQVGLPLALLSRLTFGRPFAHVMVVHILSVGKKHLLYRAFRLGRYVDSMVVYSSAQERFVTEQLGFPADRVLLTPFMVDTTFFAPDRVRATPQEQPMICSAGLELRDYPTLVEAVRDVDVRVVLAAASPWSKRRDDTGDDRPDNVEVTRLGFVDLRQLYADAAFVVMPLQENDFQAGVTTILEAMAMGKVVVCSRTRGQTDVLTDDVTGVYVAPGDAAALRRAIEELLADPQRRDRLGAAARAFVVEACDLAVYADRLAALVSAARARYQES